MKNIISEFEQNRLSNYNNLKNKIEDKLLYSILNQSKQLDNYIVINSKLQLNKFEIKLKI